MLFYINVSRIFLIHHICMYHILAIISSCICLLRLCIHIFIKFFLCKCLSYSFYVLHTYLNHVFPTYVFTMFFSFIYIIYIIYILSAIIKSRITSAIIKKKKLMIDAVIYRYSLWLSQKKKIIIDEWCRITSAIINFFFLMID